jgi:trehalose/maltose hydrolase-like predicted phosphorylase
MNDDDLLTGQYRFEEGWMIRDLAPYVPQNEVSRATVFALANGYMGSRGAPESAPLGLPGVVGHYINGLYDTPTGGILDREMFNLPAWTPVQIQVSGHILDLTGPYVQGYARLLDMRRGLLQQTMRWRVPDGPTVTVQSERLVSMTRPHLAAVRWQIEADGECEVVLHSALDAGVQNRYAASHFAAVRPLADADRSSVVIETINPGYRVVTAAQHTVQGNVISHGETAPLRATQHFTFHLSAHQPVTFIKWVAVYDSRFSAGDLDAVVERELAAAQVAGYEAIRAEHVARWAELWDSSDVIIEGDDQAQGALRFCLFHLLANVPHSDQVSVSARGLQGPDYWGSIFWDCDIYVLPFFTYTQPDYARRSLIYRYHTLDGARRKAQGLGLRGAYYAWQSQETGDETCALYVFDDPRTGQKIRSYFADEQIHISADVVYALWQYLQAAGDWEFMSGYGLEIVCEVARFFASRVTTVGNRCELRTVLGPDEYHEQVNNNAYTNALARFSLDTALSALETMRTAQPTACAEIKAKIGLTEDEIATWQRIAECLCVPDPDPASSLIPQFDGYFALEDALPEVVRPRLAHPDLHPGGPLGPYQTTQSIKQADVIMLLYLLRHRYSKAVKEANWHYYEPRTAHDSSLSPMAYALVAADVGMTDWAYRYFLHTAMLDLLGTGPHWNLGVHTAALGGAWQTVVNGFCQIELDSEGIHLQAWPALPARWHHVRFGFYWHGQLVRFNSNGQETRFNVDAGTVPVFYPGGQAEIRADQELVLTHRMDQ